MTTPPQAVVAAAVAAARKWGIPASISLAQWAIESGWGQHDLGCFNYFGMKAPCGADGKPNCAYVTLRTREQDAHGRNYYVEAPFRRFGSVEEAFDSHARLLAKARCYGKARKALPDPEGFADALTGVYATDRGYGKALKAVMRGSDLYRYDRA